MISFRNTHDPHYHDLIIHYENVAERTVELRLHINKRVTSTFLIYLDKIIDGEAFLTRMCTQFTENRVLKLLIVESVNLV